MRGQEDHTYKLTKAEYLQYRSNWFPQLNYSGNNGPMASRPDYREAVALKNHLHSVSKDYQKPSHHKIKIEYEKAINSQKFTVKDLEWTRKLGGHSGHPAGGRVINGTGKSFNQVG